ncbi:hypothetical protein ACFLV7_08695 [Chloroflexota bacterium]
MDVIVSVPVLKGRSLSPRVVEFVLTQGGVSLQLCITAEESAEIPDFLYTFPDDRVHINSSFTPGIEGCHNYALSYYKAEYFFLLAPDTLLLPGALAGLVKELRANPEIVLSMGTGYHGANLEIDLTLTEFRRQYPQLDLF